MKYTYFTQNTDKQIGKKIQELRLASKLSRNELARATHVTGQQIQKYEEGRNRVSASRLILIARALGEDVGYFYGDLQSNDAEHRVISESQRLCLEVSKNFMKIRESLCQEAVSKIIAALAI